MATEQKQSWLRKVFGHYAKQQAFTAKVAHKIFDKGGALLQMKGVPLPVSKGLSELSSVAHKAWERAGQSAGDGDSFEDGLIKVKQAAADELSAGSGGIKALLMKFAADLPGGDSKKGAFSKELLNKLADELPGDATEKEAPSKAPLKSLLPRSNNP